MNQFYRDYKDNSGLEQYDPTVAFYRNNVIVFIMKWITQAFPRL